MINLNPQILEKDGEKEFAVIPLPIVKTENCAF